MKQEASVKTWDMPHFAEISECHVVNINKSSSQSFFQRFKFGKKPFIIVRAASSVIPGVPETRWGMQNSIISSCPT